MAVRIITGRNGFHELEKMYINTSLPTNSQTKIDILKELINKARTTEQIEELRDHVATLKKYENDDNQKIKSIIRETVNLFQRKKELINNNLGKLGPPEEEHIKKFFITKSKIEKSKIFKKIKNSDFSFEDMLELFIKYSGKSSFINRGLWGLLVNKAKTENEKLILYNLSQKKRRGKLLKLDSFANFENPEKGDMDYWINEFLKTTYKKRKGFCINKIIEAGTEFNFNQWLDIYKSHDSLALRKGLFSKILSSTKSIDDCIIFYKLLSIKRYKKKTVQKIVKLINTPKDIEEIRRKISVHDSIFYEISKALVSQKKK